MYRNYLTDEPSVANVGRGAANTYVYWHGGKMLVLKEDSLPYYIDPYSLQTLGRWDFDGKWTASSMSAHPKIDPITGEMIAYAYQARGDLSDDMAVYTVNPSGHIVKEVWLKSPYLGIIHDIAITQKHIVIPDSGDRAYDEPRAAAHGRADVGVGRRPADDGGSFAARR